MAKNLDAYTENRALTALAETALQAYPFLQNPQLNFLRHNENLTYQVVDQANEARHFLRIHLPRHSGFRGLQQDTQAISSEIAWILALRRDEALGLQQPLVNNSGSYITLLESSLAADAIPCTLFTWLDGENFRQDEPRAERLVIQLGELVSRLHQHTRRWHYPGNFKRPTYDAAELRLAMENLERGVALGVISPGDFQMLSRASEVIMQVLADLPHSRKNWGLLHADLLGNLLVVNNHLIPIDFSLCGLGYYLMEVGQCLINLKKHLRLAFLAGYEGEFSDEEEHWIGAFALMIILLSASRQVQNPEWQNWFERRIPVIAQEDCRRFLDGEVFYLDV